MLKTGTANKPIDAVQNVSEKLTLKLTPNLTPTAYSGCNHSATIGSEQDSFQENNENVNCSNSSRLGIKKDSLSLAVSKKDKTGGSGIRTHDNGFAIRRLSPLGHAAIDLLSKFLYYF